jgi:hypothetical protein
MEKEARAKIANKYFMILFLLVIIFPAEEVKLQ